jgi:hypothetical protein
MPCASPVTGRRRGRIRAPLGLACAAAVASLAFAFRDGKDAQPFPFNHAAHVNAKVDCLSCHEGVLDPEEARLPALRSCLSCHKEPPGQNSGLQRLAELSASNRPLHWRSLLTLPDHVHFSHPRHVEAGGLECVECHGDMPARTRPPEAHRTMPMDRCTACHAAHPEKPGAVRARRDCITCHR